MQSVQHSTFLLLLPLVFVFINRTCYYHVSAFNIEERNPIVKRAKSDEKGSYFGFSVAQHQSERDSGSLTDNWILVGAPLGQNIQPRSNRSGALFKCPVSTNAYDCVQVVTDGRRFNEFDYDENSEDNNNQEAPVLHPPGVDEIKEGQWLGVTVKSQKPGGKVIVCAHRYIQSPNIAVKDHYGLGLCYVLSNQLGVEEELLPCRGRPMFKLHQQYGLCQVGTSLALLEDGVALMGSPGPYTWRGTIFAKQVVGAFLEKDKTTYKGPLNDDAKPIDKYSYLGMSVGGGYIFNRDNISYIAGAPRSQLYGQVYFFTRRKNAEELNISLILTGEQFASSFGYEILAVDIDRDGYDELLVGAPFYYDNEQHGGAVYIYWNLRNCSGDDCKWDMVLRGKTESRFGFSMTALGDINKDGYTDVAIGAPYENDEGAIYIYLGAKNGVNSEPSQVIRKRGLKTLGYSLSGGLDMDNNAYPDLLVGAYESDLAILYKTRPIIDITIVVEGPELANINASKKGCAKDPTNLNNTCFSFKSCFTMNDYIIKKSFKVQYQIKEVFSKKVSRVWFRDERHSDKRESFNLDYINVTNPRGRYCQSETLYIKENVRDILSPIKFFVNYTLDNNDIDAPILNKTSVKAFEATFQKNCGEDDVCESKLILNSELLLNKTTDDYTINLGSGKGQFQLVANVTNDGESAYEAKLFVVHPKAVSYISLEKSNHPVICSYTNDTLVVCNLGNPLHARRAISIKLKFEILQNTRDQTLDLRVFVNSTSTELSDHTTESFSIVLQKIAEYSISGKTLTPHLFFGGDVRGETDMKSLEDIGAKVWHSYEIVNIGEWPIQDMEVNIYWPYQVYSKNVEQPGKWLLYMESTPEIDNSESNFCYVEPLEAINPLKLKSSIDDDNNINNEEDVNKSTIEEKEKLLFHQENITTSSSSSSSSNYNTRSRRRRDADYVVSPTIITSKDGKKRKVVSMECRENSSRCVRVTCKIYRLSKAEPVTIKIFSRIWNSTLVEDYSNVDWVSIKSYAEISIIDDSITSSNSSINVTSVETVAYPDIVLADSGINIWIIVGAVLAGLLLLILLIYILYKVGFFKRNRIKDQTLSGNLKKQGESESLLKVNEGKT